MGILLTATLLSAIVAPGASDADEPVRLAKRAVQAKTQVAEERIAVVSAEGQHWNDASLGCPEKGQVYAQVATDGHRVRLRVDDRIFDVRVAGGEARICLGTTNDEPEPVAAARLYRIARKDLATRLAVVEKDIVVDFVRATTWPDASLGCKATSPAPRDERRGFLIQLSHGKRSYEYHADAERVVLCQR
jgi:hypothetical protein